MIDGTYSIGLCLVAIAAENAVAGRFPGGGTIATTRIRTALPPIAAVALLTMVPAAVAWLFFLYLLRPWGVEYLTGLIYLAGVVFTALAAESGLFAVGSYVRIKRLFTPSMVSAAIIGLAGLVPAVMGGGTAPQGRTGGLYACVVLTGVYAVLRLLYYGVREKIGDNAGIALGGDLWIAGLLALVCMGFVPFFG